MAKPELVGIAPDVRGIVMNIDRQVTEDADPPGVRIGPQRLPLLVEEEQRDLPDRNPVGERDAAPRHCSRRAISLFWLPPPPRRITVLRLRGEEVCGVLEPGLARPERVEGRPPRMVRSTQERLRRGKQRRQLRVRQLREGNLGVAYRPRRIALEQAALAQRLQIDQPRVAGES